MVDGIGNLYLFSVFRDGEWRLVASTSRSGADEEDVESVLGLSLNEIRFARKMLFEDIASPLVVMHKCENELKPLIIVRSMLFESAMCVAIETDDAFLAVLRGDNKFVLSPSVLKYAELHKERECFDPTSIASSYNIAEALSLLSFSPNGGIADSGIFDSLILCVKGILGIEIDVDPIGADIMYTGSDGIIFLGGFCVCSFMAMAISAKMFSSDGRMRMSASCHSGHLVLKMSYTNSKRRAWGSADLLSNVADAYGVALAVSVAQGKTECSMIPERVDEAVNGVKEGLISSFGLF